MGLHTWDISSSLKIQYSKVRHLDAFPTAPYKLNTEYAVDLHIFLFLLGCPARL